MGGGTKQPLVGREGEKVDWVEVRECRGDGNLIWYRVREKD